MKQIILIMSASICILYTMETKNEDIKNDYDAAAELFYLRNCLEFI